MQALGIYIHIPFCVKKCNYCDFYSHAATPKQMDSYLDSVKKELFKYSYLCERYSINTIYFGGGTPSLFGAHRILSVIDTITDIFCHDLKEITVECNPDSATLDFFSSLRGGGVNRISLGMQTAVSSELHSLGRRHTNKNIEDSVLNLRHVGFDNFSLDLMLGIPDQTLESLDVTLGFIKDLRPTHLSAYLLKVESGTPFYLMGEKLVLPDEDLCCDLYDYTCNFAQNMGLSQYEISNFASDEFRCLHNLTYWNCNPYLGIGPGAHSFVDGKRFYYSNNTDIFIKNSNLNDIIKIHDGDGGDMAEYIMLGLRLSDGISLSTIRRQDEQMYLRLFKNAKKLQDIGMVNILGDRISLTKKALLISNTIISQFLYN